MKGELIAVNQRGEAEEAEVEVEVEVQLSKFN